MAIASAVVGNDDTNGWILSFGPEQAGKSGLC
jgi:hypothetical protein